ncbi:histidine triad nucleotide-binding protein [Succinatimonas hippei]|uniref:Histidine triad domain protein n=1 Tax=Succinatimonas hippei (strain DSM 22608 / JCM 16073 / KCTC 15190 / YIT 12066) TaxID=762983 RepID=E8LJB3_SUCHY|nr:histidine triad nucleotide-binding protein [Succinatimonas hippei]EFY07384.1 histidine triad domain protein [Succinatimonas hippei YIT 12066]MCL1603860.1 histidine triad nucleotide-binding protein [Succinatimonas hippei]MDM8120147.1 histidine triad nucleotide-binding protein [Succinatimonas hippei]
MAEETIFTKIINGTIPSKIIYHDELVSAFADINPKAEHHILIVTNKPIPSVAEVTKDDEPALGRLFTVARKIAEDLNVNESGYRLIVNVGKDGGQEVPHIHMHLLAGGKLGGLGFPDKK